MIIFFTLSFQDNLSDTCLERSSSADATEPSDSQFHFTHPCWQIQCPRISWHRETPAGNRTLDRWPILSGHILIQMIH